MRWQWIGLAVLGSIGYWVLWGPQLRLVILDDEDNDDDGEHMAIIIGDETGDVGVDEYEDDMGEPDDEVEVESDGNAE